MSDGRVLGRPPAELIDLRRVFRAARAYLADQTPGRLSALRGMVEMAEETYGTATAEEVRRG